VHRNLAALGPVFCHLAKRLNYKCLTSHYVSIHKTNRHRAFQIVVCNSSAISTVDGHRVSITLSHRMTSDSRVKASACELNKAFGRHRIGGTECLR
jgi:hypothetical protein